MLVVPAENPVQTIEKVFFFMEAVRLPRIND